MHYSTYRQELTKRRKEKRDHDWTIGIFILAFSLLALTNILVIAHREGPKTLQIENQAIIYQLESQDVSMVAKQADKPIKNVPSGTQIEVIKTKTQFFDNEVNIRLASEQACAYVGLDNNECVEDLVGIAYAETRSFNCLSSGDSGKAIGCFQIHLGYHPEITVKQAQDPFWAATWTAKRLVSKGYPKYRSASIMSHNGTPGTDKTLGYLATVNSFVFSN